MPLAKYRLYRVVEIHDAFCTTYLQIYLQRLGNGDDRAHV